MHAQQMVADISMPPILVTIQQACGLIGRGQAAIYDLIGNGKIKAVKSDGRTLIVVESLQAYAAALPAAKIRPRRKRPPVRLRAG